jgi:hypothetical protein
VDGEPGHDRDSDLVDGIGCWLVKAKVVTSLACMPARHALSAETLTPACFLKRCKGEEAEEASICNPDHGSSVPNGLGLHPFVACHDV